MGIIVRAIHSLNSLQGCDIADYIGKHFKGHSTGYSELSSNRDYARFSNYR